MSESPPGLPPVPAGQYLPEPVPETFTPLVSVASTATSIAGAAILAALVAVLAVCATVLVAGGHGAPDWFGIAAATGIGAAVVISALAVRR